MGPSAMHVEVQGWLRDFCWMLRRSKAAAAIISARAQEWLRTELGKVKNRRKVTTKPVKPVMPASQFRGVHPHSSSSYDKIRWQARARGKFLGEFATEQLAVRAVAAATKGTTRTLRRKEGGKRSSPATRLFKVVLPIFKARAFQLSWGVRGFRLCHAQATTSRLVPAGTPYKII